MSYKIDHIVWAVPNFEKGIEYFENLTGVTPTFGGYHKTLGTKNALVNLGDGIYFEILAIDEDSPIKPPRWMGIDLITKPTVTRWALKSSDLEKDSQVLKNYHSDLAEIKGGQRTLSSGDILKWQLTMPLAEPEIEVAPFLLNWSASAAHPTNNLPIECNLVEIQFSHPSPKSIRPLLKYFGFEKFLKKGDKEKISIKLKTPLGIVEID